MCTNFTPTRNTTWVESNFGVDLPVAQYPAETYPGYLAPIVLKSHKTSRVACGLAKFGLIPSWAKEEKIGRHTYNARSETVRDKPSYRAAWKQRRFAIALVENFYEPSYQTGQAQRCKIELASHEPFGIASIWDTWVVPNTGEVVTSFSMLTINADDHPVMNQFHREGDEKRTPVVLMPDQFDAWLGADDAGAMGMMRWDRFGDCLKSASYF